MTKNRHSKSNSESERVFNLAEFDIDYSNMEENFRDLAILAAKIAGTKVSLINLIDSFTQWTIAKEGFDISQMPREDSVCQYTIAAEDHFEIPDLSADDRFKDKTYVSGPAQFRYYFGVPLVSPEGYNLGALCVIDTALKTLSPEKQELLKIIANEIVNRLEVTRTIDSLKQSLVEAKEIQKKVAHNIRGPIAGIIGLTELIREQGADNTMDDLLESIDLIHKSSSTVLEITNEIFTEQQPLKRDQFNLGTFKDRLEQLYDPQAKDKGIAFQISISQRTRYVAFSKTKLLQITGNIINSALKSGSGNGQLTVDLELQPEATYNLLKIKVKDAAMKLGTAAVNKILGQETVAEDAAEDKSYVAGLSLAKRMTEEMQGEFKIRSTEENGTITEVFLHQTYV
jgi:signal transduction histidine kinase